MALKITVIEDPSATDRQAVLAPLQAYNVRQAGDPHIRLVALLLEEEDGTRVGGLWGRAVYDWLFVELLAVPESHRGQGLGTALMRQVEDLARAHGCVGVWLDTFDFQARGFYERLGYTVFGALEDHPVGHRRFFLRKRLATTT